jgi:hypothetical protein
MKKLLLFAIIILLISLEVHAYQPAKNIEDLQRNSIEQSTIIFFGELLSTDFEKSLVKYKIFEKFKGEYGFDTIEIEFSDEDYPGLIRVGGEHIEPFKGLWLVYLTKTEDSKYHFYRDLSRSIQHPEDLFIWPYVLKKTDKNYNETELRIDAINDWLLELTKLKKLKQSEAVIEEDKGSEKFMIFPTILSVVNFLILIYILTKRKASH